MGTVVSLSLAAEATTTDDAWGGGSAGDGPAGFAPDDPVTVALARAIIALHDADRVFSTWKPRSPMSRLRRGEIEPRRGAARGGRGARALPPRA